jgi:glycosyltransferase involved in cell wall biosynthesis
MIRQKRSKVVLTIQEHSYGGASKQVFWTLQSLHNQGYESVLISNAEKTWLGEEIRAAGLSTKTYYTPWIQRGFNPIKELLVLLYFIFVLLREKPDAILLGGAKLILEGGIASWICGIPKRYACIHGLGSPPNSPMAKLSLMGFRLLAALKTRFITICDFDHNLLLSKGALNPHRLVQVHNGTDIEFVRSGLPGHFRKSQNLPDDAIVIGMVGRLAKQKRYEHFIQMMTELIPENEQVYGFLIGDGPLRKALQSQIDRTPYRDRIRITGYLAAMNHVYADLDISVLLTHYEGLPNALAESCAAGIPMVATRICGNPEIVIHGENGYLVDSLEEAVYCVQQLIQDSTLRHTFGQRAKVLAERKNDYRKQTQQLIQVVTT